MTSPAGPPPTGGGGEQRSVRLLAVTACPTGIAHTYMAAEKLAQAAESRGIDMKVETQGSIGAENVLDDNDVAQADGVIVAADKDVDLSRFAGKRVLTVGVAEGIRHPEQLIDRVLSAPVHVAGGAPTAPASAGGRERGAGYKALMNGVSYMIPFVVVGGLLIAISLSLGGHTDPSGGLVIPKDSFWMDVNNIGVIGFTLMVPILSGYIAYAIGDRPALVPGMIGGWIANTGELYDSKAGAGFIGAIVTGFLAGYLVRWIKKVKVPKFAQPIMPIIVIPIVATTALGLFFIHVIGKPISWVFEHLTDWLGGMTGTSAVLLGAILGLMIAFDMGGPVNKTAFLFGAGLIATGNQTVMGMCAAAIPVMPLGQGLATLLRRRLYSEQERETGFAALFMGCFGISEGAIPFAAARPAQVIPANMLGGAVAGAIAGVAGVEDAVPHGGPIVAVLGAVSGVPMFFVAVVIGSVVTALTTVALVDVSERGRRGAVAPAGAGAVAPEPVPVGAGAGGAAAPVESAAAVPASSASSAGGAGEVLSGHLTERTVRVRLDAADKAAAIREMAALLARSGRVVDEDELVATALRREEQGTTGLGEEIAVPHAKTDAVSAPVVGFARSAEGVEWDSPDGTKARLVFMIAVPEAAAGDEHLRILALLSRKLTDAGFRERLLAAPDEGAVVEVLREVG
ncbi:MULTISPECIES: fructose-specific PTS transporter subunit EIIC [unclassified Streptomyces]|uniref:fructose-specific PTS transporter subunit EIIC n=1 Tax=unclassified Streptomyces TaxID=2593676 RepID=UPI000749DF40|nr:MULTISPECIES: fructose-specific PTS transporter subunit EIIC [unclassified Streptomyces]KUL78599.1 PTS fructose transporter subunit IIC [Streptomyces sp. NRRL WC-3605]KUL80762.1 PTS fructose transporter subunit IIC [Streptomyces sp. NRRL WC-3604]